MANRGAPGRSWTVVFALALVTACGGALAAPTSPPDSAANPPAGPAFPVPPVSNPSSAAVAVEDPFVIVRADGSRFAYEVRFRLRETSGRSGATVTGVVVYSPSGADDTGPRCWVDSIRVPSLGTLDVFYTDDGSRSLSYCTPGSEGDVALPSLHVIVTFADDNGVTGSIGFPISSIR